MNFGHFKHCNFIWILTFPLSTLFLLIQCKRSPFRIQHDYMPPKLVSNRSFE
ncbi:uncharacterized protein V1516DRAFT_689155 [Lipomyces oligophaga]|uniref:uncharacterized protein n=1 Tax=Lipomyces oligophaga TaxID=45792 RepID=UPI0034CEFEA2